MRLPALETKGLNLPGIMQAQQNYRLGEAELAQYGREAKREETISGLRSDVVSRKAGASDLLASISPEDLKEVTTALSGWDDYERETSRRHIKSAMRILGPIMQVPQEGRAMAWAQGLEQARKEGIDLSLLPGVTEKDVTPQFIPGMAEKLGLKLGAAWEELQEKSTTQSTTLQRDVPYIAKTLGVSNKEAMKLKIFSRTTTREDFVRQAALRFSSQLQDPEEATRNAEELASFIYDGKPISEQPTEAGGGGIISWTKDFIGSLVGGEGGAVAEEEAKVIDLRDDLKAKADANEFTVDELAALKKSDPEQYKLLREYVQGE